MRYGFVRTDTGEVLARIDKGVMTWRHIVKEGEHAIVATTLEWRDRMARDLTEMAGVQITAFPLGIWRMAGYKSVVTPTPSSPIGIIQKLD